MIRCKHHVIVDCGKHVDEVCFYNKPLYYMIIENDISTPAHCPCENYEPGIKDNKDDSL